MARRGKARGRYWLAFWLVGFFAVAATVLLRQTASYDVAARLRELKKTRGGLEALQAQTERRIQVASTAQVLLPKVARLGLAVPPDTATTILMIGDSTVGGRDR